MMDWTFNKKIDKSFRWVVEEEGLSGAADGLRDAVKNCLEGCDVEEMSLMYLQQDIMIEFYRLKGKYISLHMLRWPWPY